MLPARRSRSSLLYRLVIALCVGAFALVAVGCGDDSSESPGGSASGSSASGSAAGGDLLAKAREEGKIRVGFSQEVPYSFLDESGRLTGENPEVTRAVMKELGVAEIEGVLTKFESLIPGLLAGRFDVIAGSMYINPERCEQIVFSEPDYLGFTSFAVKEGNPEGISSYEDVIRSGANVGIIANTADLDYLRSNRVPDSQIQQFPDQASLIDGLRSGRIDAAAASTLSLTTALEKDGNEDLEVTESFAPVVDGHPVVQGAGIGFRKEDAEFRDAFNEKLEELQRDGTIVRLLEPFGFPAKDVKAAEQVTAEQLCSGEPIDLEL